ncbi:ATP-dependent transcriptional regulator [Rhodococcus ruber Chol-4]|nr:ATP-dependent transcriptional regulator [Rhodococcus ruber Chol-4]
MAGEGPLIGRTEELRLLEGALDGTDGYRGCVIAGQAGVGKSRLAHELVLRAMSAGFSVRSAVGTASARTVPLGALAGWCDHPTSNPLQLIDQLVQSSASGGSDEVLSVDDAHLLDELSAFVIHHVAVRGTARLIVTVRSGEPAPDAVTALWKDGMLHRLDLQPLSRSESDALLASVLGSPVDEKSASRVWNLTRGNALYLRHLVAQEMTSGRLRECHGSWCWQGEFTVSDSIADLLGEQIRRLPEAVRTVLDTVAVAEPLPVAVLSEVSDLDAVEEAENRGLIRIDAEGRPRTARMAHPLYGELRRARAGDTRLRRLRGRVVSALAARPPSGPEDVVRRAVLHTDSDLPIDPDLFLSAARGAMALLDLSLCERLAHASSLAGGGAEADLCRAHALLLLNRGTEAEDVLAAMTLESLTDDRLARLLTLRATNMLWILARSEESKRIVDDALGDAPPTVAESLRAVRTVQSAVAGDPLAALELGRDVDTTRVPPSAAMCAIWGTVIAAGDVGESDLASETASMGYRLAASWQEASYQRVGLVEFHVGAMLLAGEVAEAEAVAARTYRECIRLPGVTSAVGTAIAGMAALGGGRLALALEHLERAFAEFKSLDYPVLMYRYGILLAQALAMAGRSTAATALLSDVDQHRHPAFDFVDSERLLAHAWNHAALGEISTAAAVALRAAEYAVAHHQKAREVMCLQVAVHLGDATGRVRLAQLAENTRNRRACIAAAFASAVSAHDAEALSSVATQFEEMGDTAAAADAAARAALAFARANLRGSSLTLGARAQRLAQECGGLTTPALREMADRDLPLTPREREVISMVMRGLTNRQIAEALTMSVRTVEGHLYRAQVKTGTHDRHELAALLREQWH